MFKQINKSLRFGIILIIAIFLTLAFSISLQSLLASWTAPTSTPPSNNIPDLIVGGKLGVIGNTLVMGNFAASNTKMALFADTTTGNVGIGTINPTGKIDVADDTNGDTTIFVKNINTGNSAQSRIYLLGASGDGGGTITYYNKNYNIAGRTHLADRLAITADSLTNGLSILSTSIAPSSDIRFFTGGDQAGSERLRIDSIGNVGIGTTNPQAKLDVAGLIRNSAPSQGTLELSGLLPGYADNTYPTIKTSGAYLYLSTSGKYTGYIGNGGIMGLFNTSMANNVQINASGISWLNGGNVGIGTTNPGQKLQVEGNIQAQRIKFPGVGGNSGVGGDYYSIYQEAGAWSYPYPDLVIQYHTGIKYDAYGGYGGHQFFTDYNGTGNPTGLKMQITDKVYVNDVCTTPGGKCLSATGGGLSGYEIKTVANSTGGGWTYTNAYCSAGKKVIGGGCTGVHSMENIDQPMTNGSGWSCGIYNQNVPSTWYAFAICVNAN